MGSAEAEKVRRAAVLRRVPIGAVRALIRDADRRDEESGAVLFEEGDPGGSVFLVLRGSVRITKALGEGRSARVALRSGLDWVGELSLKAGEKRSATAVTEAKTRLLEIPTLRFVAVLKEYPEAALDLLHLVSDRLRESDEGLLDALRKRTEELLTANERLGAQVRRLRKADDQELEAFVGPSAHAIRIRKAAARAARSSAPVLLVGEPGVGKELLARLVHEASSRGDQSFASIDCGLFDGPIVEAELFGHAKGALPGVRDSKAGAIERADGGSLCLGNLEALPRAAQGLLHRFLELGEFQRVGESRVRQADVRIIASTSIDPALASREGDLRADLVTRVDLMRIVVPPLRHRRNDVPLLAARMADECAARRGTAPLELAPSALQVLCRYDYPENADELLGEIEGLYAALEPGATVTSRDLSAKFIQGDPSTAELYSEAVRAFKAQLITTAVAEAGGHRARAAERLGLHPSNLSRMVRDLELDDVL
jgi:two-component system response regulator AtoC